MNFRVNFPDDSVRFFRVRLGVARLFQIHFPFPYFGGMDALAEGLSKACDRGLCRSVGVSNFNAKQVNLEEQVNRAGDSAQRSRVATKFPNNFWWAWVCLASCIGALVHWGRTGAERLSLVWQAACRLFGRCLGCRACARVQEGRGQQTAVVPPS